MKPYGYSNKTSPKCCSGHDSYPIGDWYNKSKYHSTNFKKRIKRKLKRLERINGKIIIQMEQGV